MTFTYEVMKRLAEKSEDVGIFRGKRLRSIASYAGFQDKLNKHCCYVIYNEGNIIITYYESSSDWYVIGFLTVNGIIEFYQESYRYKGIRRVEAKEEKKIVEKEDKKDLEREKWVEDVVVMELVEDVLNNARNMTIDKLLEGFNYGLE